MPRDDGTNDAAQSPRAVRLDTRRVRLGMADGILLNLSTTGALVRMPEHLLAATDSMLSLYADDRWVQVRCRIVRCTKTDVMIEGAVWRHTEFETAVTFDEADALATLLETVGRHGPA